MRVLGSGLIRVFEVFDEGAHFEAGETREFMPPAEFGWGDVALIGRDIQLTLHFR